jgi:signal transduction histidine kinase
MNKPDVTTALAEITSAVVGQFELNDKLLNPILDTTMKLLDAEVCSIFLKKEDDPNKIKCIAGSGFAKKIVGIAEYEYGEGLTGNVAKTGEPYNINSVKDLEEEIKKRRWKGKYDNVQWDDRNKQFRNLLALPLRIKEQIFGVIKVENKKYDNYFTDEDLTVFKTIANVIALAIENARFHEKNESQLKAVSEVVSQVTNAFVGNFEMNALLQSIIDTTMKALNAEVCSIFLEDKEKKPGYIKCVAGSGFAKVFVHNRAEYCRGEGFTGGIFESGKEENIKNRKQLERWSWKGKYDNELWAKDGKNQFRNMLALPLKIKGEIIGVIKAENKIETYGSFFSDEDLANFRTITNIIALVIENARLYEQTEKWLKSISSRAAHRIGNQLTNYDYIELMLQREARKESPDNQKLMEFSEKIGEYTRSLKRTNTEFKEFGKPIVLKKEFKNLNTLIHDEILSADHKTNETKQEQGIDITAEINIVSHLDDKLPEFKFDNRLAESIKELISNAQRAISETVTKKGTIIIQTEYLTESNRAKIVIQDDGPGISNPETLFTPFYSSNPNRTGLGLTTVKQLLQAHGGDIVYVLHEGARFELILPTAKD